MGMPIKEIAHRWYLKRRNAGLCTKCSNSAVEGRTMCKPCLEKLNAYVKSRYVRKKVRREESPC